MMNANVGRSIARILIAVAICLSAGFWALLVLFSDTPTGQTRVVWLLYLAAGHLLAGFIVGLLLPLRWQFSVASAWGANLTGLLGLVSFASGSDSVSTAVPTLWRVALIVFALAMVPGVSAAGGYCGSQVARKRAPKSTNIKPAV
jgi:peptidoglycan/LPS O-acetylase OafA/YrhL